MAAHEPVLDPRMLDRVQVVGRRPALIGEAFSASEGIATRVDIAERPRSRTGDLLEFVPGLIATAHSGSGKANQYFLRGFNLDHGTDFATFVDGMPVNMRTHGHGQGYTDLGFLIPEAVESLSFHKGNYQADVGDFASAGNARFRIGATLPGQVDVSAGSHGYARGLVTGSTEIGAGNLAYAGEAQTYDGPWTDIDEDVRKANLLLRYGGDVGAGQGHVMLMGYDNRWNSADQLPLRAIESGLVDRLGSLDPTLGGESSRYSLSGGWQGPAMGGRLDASAYAIDYSMRLWSNFTYFLDDPEQGDQFAQVDERRIYGFALTQAWTHGTTKWRVGADGRLDDIDRVALLRTVARQPVGTVRDDRVEESSLGVFASGEFRLAPSLRAYAGLRHDAYRFDVDSSEPLNSGASSAGITSYKGNLAWRPTEAVEVYASAGTGFHSNDARGTTIRVDPGSGEPVARVDPLVASRGFELGLRLQQGRRLQATFAAWTLDLDQELLFVGDAGTTEASRPSSRRGVEVGAYWAPHARLNANLELAWTHARFTDGDPAGPHIPGAAPFVLGAGVTWRPAAGWSINTQVRHFGRYALIEDARERADGSTLVNLRLAREAGPLTVALDVLNLLDSEDHDVDYFYASRLPGEPDEGVEDRHFHVFAPRALRLSLGWRF